MCSLLSTSTFRSSYFGIYAHFITPIRHYAIIIIIYFFFVLSHIPFVC